MKGLSNTILNYALQSMIYSTLDESKQAIPLTNANQLSIDQGIGLPFMSKANKFSQKVNISNSILREIKITNADTTSL